MNLFIHNQYERFREVPFLSRLQVTRESILSGEPFPDLDIVTNGLVLDLYSFCLDNNMIIKDYLYKFISACSKTDIETINAEATLAKIHRALKTCKTKRKNEEKELFLSQKFSIPVSTASAPRDTSSSAMPTPEQKETVNLKLKQQSTKMAAAREKSKQLKRKLERSEKRCDEKKLKLSISENETKKLRIELKDSKKNEKTLQRKLTQTMVKNAKLTNCMKDMKNAKAAMKNDLKNKTEEIQLIQSVLDETEEVVSYAEKNKKELQEANETIDFMNDIINDNPELAVYDEAEHKYTNETVQCVMNLTDMKVPTEKVENVMKEVAKLCGKNINRVPSASTVNRIVDSKVALSETQIGSVLKEKENTTLYTDETRKINMANACKHT